MSDSPSPPEMFRGRLVPHTIGLFFTATTLVDSLRDYTFTNESIIPTSRTPITVFRHCFLGKLKKIQIDAYGGDAQTPVRTFPAGSRSSPRSLHLTTLLLYLSWTFIAILSR